jgi:WD40 repeat protein
MEQPQMHKEGANVRNPFPGLRPFRMDENHLFFGRENQVSEVLDKLFSNQFVSIVGNSGIGKSSFVNCGILPLLQSENNPSRQVWEVINFRPGAVPGRRLMMAIEKLSNKCNLEIESSGDVNKESDDLLAQIAHAFYAKTGKKLLLYIDQFEEIFRFSGDRLDEAEEKAYFIDLLVKAIRDKDLPVHVIITIRSDFVGDCSKYPSFTKVINDSQFLIPQMTMAEKRSAIEGPVKAMGAQIEESLVDSILESIGDRHDQLPLMQHALMRTWDHWQANKFGNEAITNSNYQTIGGMGKALSVHANEIFNELSVDQKRICERLFKSITEKGVEGRSVRRPTSVKEIAAIANTDVESVKVIVDHFRKPGRTLLTPSADVALTDRTIIDISHESLMRIWEVLANWLEEEHEAIKEYIHIAEAAEMQQVGKGTLLKSPELQLALNWRTENAPTREWGIRHNVAFDRTMQFLDYSEKKFLQEQRLKEKLQKVRLMVFKVIAGVFGLGALIAMAFFFYAQEQRKEAQKQQELANVQKEKATEQAIIAERSAKEAMKQKKRAEIEKVKAVESQRIANEQKQEAIKQTELAEKERQFAMEQKEQATIAGQRALEEEKKASRLRMISIARSMAVKSLQEPDKLLKALSARQSYNLFTQYGGNTTDPDIYSALYYAVKSLQGNTFNTAKSHFDNVREIVTLSNSNYMFSAGSDGQVFRWNKSSDGFKSKLLLLSRGNIHKAMDVSKDGTQVVVAGNYPYLKIINTNTPGEVKDVNIPVKDVQFLHFTPDNKKLVYLGGNKQIMEYNFVTSSVIAKSSLKVNAIDLSPEGKYLVVGKAKGEVMLIDLNTHEQKVLFVSETKADITSVKYSHDGNVLAVGDMSGMVRILNPQNGQEQFKLPGHTAMVNKMAFSHKGSKLATASWDHSVRIWDLNNPYSTPILLNDHNDWVWSVSFSRNDQYLLAGCRDNLIRTWLLDMERMAKMICKSEVLDRNFTSGEWENYVAKDVDYECTCKKNPPGAGARQIPKDSIQVYFETFGKSIN